LGQIFLPDKNYFVFTLEPPWQNNMTDISCIPAGAYTCRYATNRTTAGGSFVKHTYEVTNVPGRTGILFHVGNSTKDTHGCILVGLAVGTDRKLTLQESKAGFGRFVSFLRRVESFELEIICSDELPQPFLLAQPS
jgi:hypothetical protein